MMTTVHTHFHYELNSRGDKVLYPLMLDNG